MLFRFTNSTSGRVWEINDEIYYVHSLGPILMVYEILVSEPAFGGLTCYGESFASSLVTTEGSCYNNGKFKFDRWTAANRIAR